ncbi:MAG: WYL domain-containing protein [Bacteroidia bacterium]|nr:WYL domain-containing protein [Bacteroidia bacterium]
MSKRSYLQRYLLILRRLKNYPYSSFEDISAFLEEQGAMLVEDGKMNSFLFSKRTFQRDIRDIYELFDIEITYSKAQRGYHLPIFNQTNNFSQRILDAFGDLELLKFSSDISPCIQFEGRKAFGQEFIPTIIESIQSKKKLKFSYHKFFEKHESTRVVEPFLLKEFKNRWYLLASEHPSEPVKSFGLERIQSVEITDQPCEMTNSGAIADKYINCFGIICPEQGKPYEIVLAFDTFQSKYIQTLPLHPSQTLIFENESEVHFRYYLYLTPDLIMEILSFGDTVEVLSPPELRHQIQQNLETTLSYYQNKA